MLDFICELDLIMAKWPENAAWPIPSIAEVTRTPVPLVVDFLADALGRELEINEEIAHSDAVRALNVLKKRMEPQLAARARRAQERRDKAIQAYDNAMEKVRALLVTKNWRAAYKTLSYYLGSHEADLPVETLLSAYGECLRLGTKAQTNLQELSYWLRRVVQAVMSNPDRVGLEDVLDFMDAFGDYFVSQDLDKGRKILGSILDDIAEPLAVFELTQESVAIRQRFQIGEGTR